MKIFLISPVRNITQDISMRMHEYVNQLEADEHKVYVPVRDTNQNDDTGYRICEDNFIAMKLADEIHLWWSKDSQGSIFDLGMAFCLGKPFTLANPEDIEPNEGKSFENMICYWNNLWETY